MGHPTRNKDEKPSSPPLPIEMLEFSRGEVAIRELVRSQELLRKLRQMLVETPVEVKSIMIVDEVVRSIVTSISAVQEIGVTVEDLEVEMVEGEEEEKSTVGNKPWKGVDLLKGKKEGGGTKRKWSNGSSSTQVESNTLEDDYSWRKYGQKQIQYAKFPRSYYRCSHRYDLGCRARKQVQPKEDDPSIYYITYLDQHICRDVPSNKPYHHHHHHQGFESSTSTTMVESSKQEREDQDVQVKDDEDDGFYSDLQLPSSAPAATTTMTHLSSDAMSELGDVTASFHAPVGFEMEDIFYDFQGEFI